MVVIYTVDHNKPVIKFQIIRYTHSDLFRQIAPLPEKCFFKYEISTGKGF